MPPVQPGIAVRLPTPVTASSEFCPGSPKLPQPQARCAVKTIAVTATVVLTMLVAAQPFPVRLYGDTLDERATALVTAADGFLITGWTRSRGPAAPAFSNILVIRTDARGIPVWARMSVGGHDDEAYSLVRTRDSGFALAGFTRSFGVGAPQKNAFLIRLDPQGNTVWGRVYGGLQDDEAFSVVQMHDGGFALAGRTWSFGPAPLPNILVLRTDAAGRPLWQRVYWMFPNHIEDEGWSIVQTPDRGFAITGRARTVVPNFFNPFILKLDSTGNRQWLLTVPGINADDEGHSIAVNAQGNIIAAGFTRSFGASPMLASDIYVVEVTPAGLIQWSRTYGWPADEQALGDRALVATADGGAAVCGPTTSVGPGLPNPNCLLLKIAPNGLPAWCRSHPSAYDPGLGWDVPLAVVERPGGGYATAGWTNSWPGRLGRENWLLSTFDAAGNRPVCAEAVMPPFDSLPWIDWQCADSSCRPEHDIIFLVPTAVRIDSACFDTSHVGVGAPPVRAALPAALRFSNSRVWLDLERSGTVRVELFAPDGRKAAVLFSGRLDAGRHGFAIPAGLTRGPWFVRATGAGWNAQAKTVVR